LNFFYQALIYFFCRRITLKPRETGLTWYTIVELKVKYCREKL